MFDLDFLLSDKPALRGHVTYTYTDPYFLAPVLGRVRELARTRGWATRTVDYDNFELSCVQGSLFEAHLVLIHLGDLAQRHKRPVEAFAHVAALMLGEAENHFCLYGPPEKYADHPAWAQLRTQVTYLEQLALAPPTLPRLMNWLEQTEGFTYTNLSNGPIFSTELQAWLQDADLGLSDFVNFTNLVSATCINPETRAFDVITFRHTFPAAVRENYGQWHTLLARYLLEATEEAQHALFKLLDDAHFRGTGVQGPMDPRQIMGLMTRVTRDLLILNTTETRPEHWSEYRWRKLRESCRNVPLAKLAKWALLLARFEPLINLKGADDPMRLWDALLTFARLEQDPLLAG